MVTPRYFPLSPTSGVWTWRLYYDCIALCGKIICDETHEFGLRNEYVLKMIDGILDEILEDNTPI